MSDGAAACYYCGVTAAEWGSVPTEEWARRELRPYGPSGSWLCHPCMKSTPEREKAAGAAFGALLDANAQIGTGVVAIGEQGGPRPFDPSEAVDDECASCGEGDPQGECPVSKLSCGHHCNHIWTHDACHWCGFEEQPQ